MKIKLLLLFFFLIYNKINLLMNVLPNWLALSAESFTKLSLVFMANKNKIKKFILRKTPASDGYEKTFKVQIDK